jgi:hypothetical protein
VVDVVGDLRLQRPQRVVGQRGEVHHRVESAQLLDGHVAQVGAQAGRVHRSRAQHAVAEVAVVQAHHVVAPSLQHRDHHGAEVSLVACDQNPLCHAALPFPNLTTTLSTTNASA